MNPETREQVTDLLDANVPFALVGDPGIGKTSELGEMIRARGGHMETLIASGMEPSDFGIPLRQTEDGTVSFALPAWAKRCIDAVKAGKFTVLFIDEASQIHPAMQAPMLELWRIGRVNGDWNLPAEVRRAGAMNPTTSGGQWELNPANANRIAWVNVGADFDSWAGWMITQPDPHSIRPSIVSFLKSRPALACQVPKDAAMQSGPWPSFRSWDNACKCRTDGARAALVGAPAYSEFIQWQRVNDLPSPEDVCNGKAEIPTRPDARFAVLVAVAALAARDYKTFGAKAWKILVHVADTAPDEALVPARALALATKGTPPELGKLAPMLQKIMR